MLSSLGGRGICDARSNDAMSTESLRFATVMPSSTTLRRGTGTAEAQNAQKGWEKWHASYDTLANNSPVCCALLSTPSSF